MNPTRIDRTFTQLRAQGQKAFIAYITAGDPDLDATRETVLLLAEAGADIIELGVPFSDPLADGATNQRAAERALEAGTTFHGILEMVKAVRETSQVPLLLYSYVNPLFAHGFEASVAAAAAAGVDGVLLVDLSMEESAPFREVLRAQGLNHVVLVTPTTPEARIAKIVEGGSGFVYCVSRAGVTGEQAQVQADASGLLARTAAHTSLPVALGFGVSTPEQAASYAAMTDAVVVGSFIVNQFHKQGPGPEGRARAMAEIRPLIQAVKGVRT